MKSIALKTSFIIIASGTLMACTHHPAQQADPIPVGAFHAVADTTHVKTKIVKQYVPIPMPGQLVSATAKSRKKTLTKGKAVAQANKKSLRYPATGRFINSIMQYTFMAGARYIVYASPDNITDIQFEKGEHIISEAAGDTYNWQIAKTYSGSGKNLYAHLLVKPMISNSKTSLDVMTNQRSYHIMLVAKPNSYMAAVKWNYPTDMLTTFSKNSNGVSNTTAAPQSINLQDVNSNHKITHIVGNTSGWSPVFAFNNGRETYIHFPNGIINEDLPILAIANFSHHYATTVNDRVAGNFMIVNTVFQHARLVLGTKKDKDLSVVQIDKVNG